MKYANETINNDSSEREKKKKCNNGTIHETIITHNKNREDSLMKKALKATEGKLENINASKKDRRKRTNVPNTELRWKPVEIPSCTTRS